VSGKGGVGKSTLSAFLCKWFAARDKKVLAIDADPDANLGHALGYTAASDIIPISKMKELIHERTESVPGSFGGMFKMNPEVDDLPEKLAVPVGEDSIRLMVMGGVKKGGMGCVCPESVLLKNLVQHLVLRRDDVVIMDMEAGVEHLGRATSKAVDRLLVVVEPGRRSLETAGRIRELANDIGLTQIVLVGNKVRSQKDRDFLEKALPDFTFVGFVPYDEQIIEADLGGVFPEQMSAETEDALQALAENLASAK
jgi:CO dehydrogenase maturation factor